jgi:hypothetical protein
VVSVEVSQHKQIDLADSKLSEAGVDWLRVATNIDKCYLPLTPNHEGITLANITVYELPIPDQPRGGAHQTSTRPHQFSGQNDCDQNGTDPL